MAQEHNAPGMGTRRKLKTTSAYKQLLQQKQAQGEEKEA